MKKNILLALCLSFYTLLYAFDKDSYISTQVIHEQKVYNGIMVSFFIEEDVKVGAIIIPKHTEFYSEAKFIDGRIKFTVNKIMVGNDIVDVNLIAVGVDYEEGLSVYQKRKWYSLNGKVTFKIKS